MATDSPGEAWVRAADRALAKAMRDIPFLSAATPRGGASRAELVRAFESGSPRAPGWTYAPLDTEPAAASLDAMAVELEPRGPLGAVYAARARELAVEARIAATVGTAAFPPLARARFTPEGPASAASGLARDWVAEAEPAPPPDTTTDGNAPSSLESRMREEIGRRRLPFRVVVADGLAPLAATGDHTVWVTAGRAVSRVDVERTVLHEVEGHVAPRARATLLAARIFALGTARGTDDQEGLALLFEERRGFLRGARRRELALRHRAVEAMDDGGSFVDVVQLLMKRDGATPLAAVAVTERAFRGSGGERAGLGRERVYLSAYARVKERLAARPEDEAVLASGQIALGALDVVRPLASVAPAHPY